jgi:hypothetical protein
MGHYSSSYEDDYEQRLKEQIKQRLLLRDMLYKARMQAFSCDVPDRFVWNIDDMLNWIEVKTRE